MTGTKRVNDKLKVRNILDFIEKEIVFRVIPNAFFDVIVQRIRLHQLAVTIQFKIDDKNMILRDALCPDFVNDLPHQR